MVRQSGGTVAREVAVLDVFRRHKDLKPEGIAELNPAGMKLALTRSPVVGSNAMTRSAVESGMRSSVTGTTTLSFSAARSMYSNWPLQAM